MFKYTCLNLKNVFDKLLVKISIWDKKDINWSKFLNLKENIENICHTKNELSKKLKYKI